MSGIGGMVRLDEAPRDADIAQRLLASLAYRGTDDRGVWSDQHATLIHTMFHTTPESLLERQPLQQAASNACITADLRIDNRDDLFRELGWPGGRRGAGDAELVLAAHERWGEECVHHIEGDYAFAIWDPGARTLFCARDPFGVKPFVYTFQPARFFAFASEVQAVLALPGVPQSHDEQRIIDFLTVTFRDAEHTFYQALRRLPPGHTLTLRDGALRVSRYWYPASVRPAPRRPDAEYAEEFRGHFVRAVKDRMRAPDPRQIGSMLSGGLDSSAITCVARDENRRLGAPHLPVFSWIFSDALEADERAYQDAVIEAGGLRPLTLDSATAGHSPWSGFEELARNGPPYSPNVYLNLGAATVAKSAGVNVILDGLGGDGVVSRGAARLTELFLKGRWPALAGELRAGERLAGGNRSLAQLFLARSIGSLIPSSLVNGSRRLRGRAPRFSLSHLLRPELRRRAGRASPLLSTSRAEHLVQLQAPMLAEGLELFDRVMALGGVEGRYPFFDRRLAEFCLSLPGDQKLRDGYTRMVMRRALEGVLPPAVQWRAGKGAPGLHVIPSLRQDRSRLEALHGEDGDRLGPWVDREGLSGLARRFLEGRELEFSAVIQLWSAAALASWLKSPSAV